MSDGRDREEEEKLLKFLASMRPPPDVVDPDFDPEKLRCACNKLVPCTEGRVVDTGITRAIEPVCPPCRGDLKGLARLVCYTCKGVIGWLKPSVGPHGWKIEADKFYHVRHCPVCRKGLQKAHILEMVFYYRERGLPIDTSEL